MVVGFQLLKKWTLCTSSRLRYRLQKRDGFESKFVVAHHLLEANSSRNQGSILDLGLPVVLFFLK